MYISARGESITKNENLLKDPFLFSKKLLELKSEIDKMLNVCFYNDGNFQKSRDVSFSNFMNDCTKTPYYLAGYSDKELRSDLKGVSDEETEERLDSIVRIFCLLHARDTFLKAYTKHLS